MDSEFQRATGEQTGPELSEHLALLSSSARIRSGVPVLVAEGTHGDAKLMGDLEFVGFQVKFAAAVRAS